MQYVTRDEAESIIKEALEDYVADAYLQQILDIIYGSGEFEITGEIYDEDELD